MISLKRITIMNKILTVIGMLAMATCIGCKTTWTTDESYKVGSAVGYTTAYVLNNQTKVDDTTRGIIINVMTEVQKYVPGTNETFYAKWTPIANKYLDELVEKKDLTEKQAERVKKDFGYVVSLLDTYVEKKGIKPYQDCIDAFVNGFCTKFLENFKTTTGFCANTEEENIDQYAYGYLTAKTSK